MAASAILKAVRSGGTRRLRIACGLALLLGVVAPAAAQTTAAPAEAIPVAPYIRARPDQMLAAFSREMVMRVFSDEFTQLRRDTVMATVTHAPGVTCPERPSVVAYAIVPFKLRPDLTVWIERYAVGCATPVGRNFMAILEGAGLKLLELVRGATRADPLLQHDLSIALAGIAKSRQPQGCERFVIADTVVIEPPPPAGGPWSESWAIVSCEARSSVEITFTPSPQGGTTWAIKP